MVRRSSDEKKCTDQLWSIDQGGKPYMVVNALSPITLSSLSLFFSLSPSLSLMPHPSTRVCNHNAIKILLLSEVHYLVTSSTIGRSQPLGNLPRKVFSRGFPGSDLLDLVLCLAPIRFWIIEYKNSVLRTLRQGLDYEAFSKFIGPLNFCSQILAKT